MYTDGVHVSETITLLATPRVLTRPWCLLELWQAAARGTPLVVVHIAARGLDLQGGTGAIHARFLEDAQRLLLDLPAELAARVSAEHAESVLPELRKHSGGRPLDELQAAVAHVLQGSSACVWHPHGSDQSLLSDAKARAARLLIDY